MADDDVYSSRRRRRTRPAVACLIPAAGAADGPGDDGHEADDEVAAVAAPPAADALEALERKYRTRHAQYFRICSFGYKSRLARMPFLKQIKREAKVSNMRARYMRSCRTNKELVEQNEELTSSVGRNINNPHSRAKA